MKLILSALGCLVISLSSAQLPIILKEQFNDTSHQGWVGEGDSYSMKIENGKYVIASRARNSGCYATVSPMVLPDKDFSIEATFVQRSGSINNGFGLLWGSDGTGKHCEFLIASDGHFKIKNAEGGEQFNRWFEYKVNPNGEENVLRIESVNNKWYYYINNEEVATTDVMPVYGSRMGIINYTNMELEVDDFIFRQDIGIRLPADLTTGLIKENLGSNVNSAYDELGPIISTQGNILYFGVKNSPQNVGGVHDREDIWFSNNSDGINWLPRQNMGSQVNDEEVNNLVDISDDGKTLLLCEPNGFQIKTRTKTGWTKSERINIRFLNEAKHMEGNLAQDGRAILFTAKLKQNLHYSPDKEEKDIYISLLKKNGEWADPINLGEIVNSAGDEISPFLASDGRTLYFGSNGRPGYGSYDIYMTRRVGDSWTQWSEPVNLGPEINGPGFDAYYTLSAKADYAYMVSNNNSYGKLDIVRIKLPEAIRPMPVVMISGQTLNADTRQPIAAKIIFEETKSGEELGLTLSDAEDGIYTRTLNPGRYTLRAMAEGFLPVIEELPLEGVMKYTEIKKDLLLVPIAVGEPVRLSHVYFHQGKAILKPESYPELDRLAETLQLNSKMKIELEGHTDNVGNKSLLLKLSQDRVAEVKDYLVKKGVSRDRIKGRGYGPTRPLVPNDSEENREMNRRVEFKVLKK